MAYIGGDKVLIFGGDNGGDQTWIYDLSDNNWILDSNTTNPSTRIRHSLCETSLIGLSYLVLFGGDTGGNETWTFGGGDYALPVKLSSFIAQAGDGKVTLKWTTDSEENNLGFIIERSIRNNNSFEEMASYVNYPELEGQGNTSSQTNYSFTDNLVQNGITYKYRLSDVDFNGDRTYHNIVSATPNSQGIEIERIEPITSRFQLFQNYPNPFNPETTIKFEVPVTQSGSEKVEITIYNSIGERVKNLFSGVLDGGVYEIKWNGENNNGLKQPSGVYFVNYRTNYLLKYRKILLVK
jgi:hypothetical protein